MRASIYLKLGLVIVLMTAIQEAESQSTSANNVPATTKFLGYNAAGANLDFKTTNITRMRQMDNGTASINGGAQTVNYNGFLGLSADPAYWTSSPFLSNII